MRLFTILILTMIFTAMTISAQTAPPIEAGVSQTLARWRSANYSDVRYKLNITLEKGAPLMRGEIEIRVKLTEAAAKTALVLDWRQTQFANDKDKPFLNVIQVNESVIKELPTSGNYDYSIDKEHLFIAPRHLKAGENFIKIQFASPIKTSGAAITRYVDKEDGAEYVYSLFVPSDASTAFPVFDQPDLKARFKLAVNAPVDWKVVSNANKLSSNILIEKPDVYSIDFIFVETKPISTYVFAFAAGEFLKWNECDYYKKYFDELKCYNDAVTDYQQGSNIYVRKSQAEKFKQHAAETFRLNREAVKYLESYFDYKFPFPKYDLVLIPEFPFGGMEHAGATFLREDRVIFPTEPTKNDFITRANLIFHEAAHQWFGDTVTMRWFDDLWLKEGFAEFMAYKTLEKVMPEYNAWKIFYERNKQAAYLTDSTKGTTPIYQEIPNLSAAKSAYGNIVYRKAPSFLKQAEFYLGEKEFQTAVRAFLKKHEFANAEWTDLVNEFESEWLKRPHLLYYPRDLSENKKKSYELNQKLQLKKDFQEWANSWVKKPGVEIFYIETYSKEDKPKWVNKRDIWLSRKDNSIDYGRTQAFKVLFGFADGKRQPKDITNVRFKYSSFGQEISLKWWRENESPTFIFPNYEDYGYGIFLLDEKSRDYILQNIQNEKDDFLRTMMWGSLWDSVREAELSPKEYVELVIKVLSSDFSRQNAGQSSVRNESRNVSEKPPEGGTQNIVETDESTIQTILGRVSTAMSYYLSDTQRETLAPQVEAILIDKMQNAPTLGARITYYRAFLNIASSEKARTVLKEILSGKFKIQNLELKTKDKFDILTRLLILGEEASPLLQELAKTERTDDARRYAYGAQAGIPTAKNKKEFYDDFVNNPAIPESWIEAAFAPFNSVRHSDLTLPYLEKSLAELPNLKRNRKIFFVNGWLAAFIGGQKSEEALKIVNKFLADNPNLDKDLRLKILENADGLERAVKIRRKFSGLK